MYEKYLDRMMLKLGIKSKNELEILTDTFDEIFNEGYTEGEDKSYKNFLQENEDEQDCDNCIRCENCGIIEDEYQRGYENGYENGQEYGYKEGHEYGYEEGHKEGYEEGYNLGLDDGRSEN